MFNKCKDAGFSLFDAASLGQLGELVNQIPTEEFSMISPENIRKHLPHLKRKAGDFSPSQKKAIVKQVSEN